MEEVEIFQGVRWSLNCVYLFVKFVELVDADEAIGEDGSISSLPPMALITPYIFSFNAGSNKGPAPGIRTRGDHSRGSWLLG